MAAVTGFVLVLGLFLRQPPCCPADEKNPPRATEVSEPLADGQPQTMAQLKALEQQVRQVVEKVRPCTVGVDEGSGVVITEDGYVLTVAHVGEQAGRTVTVTFPDGRRVKAKTLGNDSGMDAGLVKINGDGPWPYAEMGHSAPLKTGVWCLALGYPVSFDRAKDPPVRIGRIRRRDEKMIVTDCAIMGGDSGGPLFDLQGRVIGIGSRCLGPLTVNLHVPIDTFRKSWDRLAAGDDFDSLAPPAAFFGVTGDPNAADVRITRVTAGSAAEAAGVKPGDVIVKFGNRQLRTFTELTRAVQKKKPGDKVKLEIRRGEETVELAVVLGKQEE